MIELDTTGWFFLSYFVSIVLGGILGLKYSLSPRLEIWPTIACIFRGSVNFNLGTGLWSFTKGM